MKNIYCPRTGKLQHATREEATRAVKRMGAVGSVYRCPICHAWHHSKLAGKQYQDRKKVLGKLWQQQQQRNKEEEQP